jgi:ferric-dicitrate binding protein FerR (iron transport regulator)
MAELVEFQLADGSKILIQGDADLAPRVDADDQEVRDLRGETDADDDHVVTRHWGDRRTVVSVASTTTQTTAVVASTTFEKAVDAIRPAAESLVKGLRSGDTVPDEITVEFGLQMSAKAGAYIAEASAGANFKVILTWRKE